jgi:hypothetical protein
MEGQSRVEGGLLRPVAVIGARNSMVFRCTTSRQARLAQQPQVQQRPGGEGGERRCAAAEDRVAMVDVWRQRRGQRDGLLRKRHDGDFHHPRQREVRVEVVFQFRRRHRTSDRSIRIGPPCSAIEVNTACPEKRWSR